MTETMNKSKHVMYISQIQDLLSPSSFNFSHLSLVHSLFVAIAIEAFNKLGTERTETETQQATTDESRTRRVSHICIVTFSKT